MPIADSMRHPGPDRPFGVVLMGLGSAKERDQAGPRDGGDRPAQALYLRDQPGQGLTHNLA